MATSTTVSIAATDFMVHFRIVATGATRQDLLVERPTFMATKCVMVEAMSAAAVVTAEGTESMFSAF